MHAKPMTTSTARASRKVRRRVPPSGSVQYDTDARTNLARLPFHAIGRSGRGNGGSLESALQVVVPKGVVAGRSRIGRRARSLASKTGRKRGYASFCTLCLMPLAALRLLVVLLVQAHFGRPRRGISCGCLGCGRRPAGVRTAPGRTWGGPPCGCLALDATRRRPQRPDDPVGTPLVDEAHNRLAVWRVGPVGDWRCRFARLRLKFAAGRDDGSTAQGWAIGVCRVDAGNPFREEVWGWAVWKPRSPWSSCSPPVRGAGSRRAISGRRTIRRRWFARGPSAWVRRGRAPRSFPFWSRG